MKKTKNLLLFALCAMIFAGCAKASAKIPEADYHAEDTYMEMAIGEAREGIYNGHGGPFGSVIVKDGKVLGQGHNMVLDRSACLKLFEEYRAMDATNY